MTTRQLLLIAVVCTVAYASHPCGQWDTPQALKSDLYAEWLAHDEPESEWADMLTNAMVACFGDASGLVPPGSHYKPTLSSSSSTSSSESELYSTVPEQIHLSVTSTPASEMVVMWVTRNTTATSTVQYSIDGDLPFSSNATGNSTTYDVGVFGGWHGRIHTVFLYGLKENTSYVYRVGDEEGGWSPANTFTTAIDAPVPTKAVLVGDMGTYIPEGWRVVDAVVYAQTHGAGFDFFHVLGDLAYAGTGRKMAFQPVWDVYQTIVEPIAANMPFMTSVGNHESYYNFDSYRHRFRMPGDEVGGRGNMWYAYTYGNLYVVSWSTEHDYSYNSTQYRWIEATLANVNRTRTPWVILTNHRPMYGSDEFAHSSHIPGAGMQTTLEPLLIEYGVDLMMYGHCHVYERIYPVIDGVVQIPTPSNTYVNPNATAHVLGGMGGAIYPDSWVLPHPSWSAVRIGPYQYGYGVLTAHNESALQYELFLINEEEEETGAGEKADEFWIVRN